MQRDAFIEDGNQLSFEIRYEGKDAEDHRIEMSSLAVSLDGFSRIYSVIGHYVATGQYAKQIPALTAKTYAKESQAKCFAVPSVMDFAVSAGMFQGMAPAVFTLILGYVLNRNSQAKEEMKHLQELFEKQLGYSQAVSERMLETIDKLAGGLQPSVKKSMVPVCESCDRIDLYLEGERSHRIDVAMKDAANSEEPSEILPEQKYVVEISELDRLKRTCKVHFIQPDSEEDVDEDGAPRRISADITDPAAILDGNAYLRAFVDGKPLPIKAKALLRAGIISKLYISDTI